MLSARAGAGPGGSPVPAVMTMWRKRSPDTRTTTGTPAGDVTESGPLGLLLKRDIRGGRLDDAKVALDSELRRFRCRPRRASNTVPRGDARFFGTES